jgi:catalase
MLQGRLILYPDAHRYRLGVNYDALPINRPQCPFATYHRDGAMRFDDNGGSSPNYEPNSFGGPTEDPRYIERPKPIAGAVARHSHRDESDHYTQAGNLFRLMTPDEKERLISNISGSLSQAPRHIQERQLCHFFRADPAYGEGVTKAIGISVDELLPMR